MRGILITIARYGLFCQAIVLLWFSTAWADTDYMCLNKCVASGIPSSRCMTQCTYIPPQSASTPLPSHDSVTTPLPYSGQLLPAAPPAAPPLEFDYPCIANCQQSGLQYQFCHEHCIRFDATHSSPLCLAKCRQNGQEDLECKRQCAKQPQNP